MEENINVNETGVENQEQEVAFTDEQKAIIEKMMQSYGDKRANDAADTREKKLRKEFEKKLSLSKLDGDERAKAEKDSRIAELEEQLAAFVVEKNRSELKSVLASRGLSAEFADIIDITDDIEASQAKIDKLDKLIKASVKAEVEKRLAAGGRDVKGNGSSTTEITKETLAKMSMVELNALATSNPELFNKLTNN